MPGEVQLCGRHMAVADHACDAAAHGGWRVWHGADDAGVCAKISSEFGNGLARHDGEDQRFRRRKTLQWSKHIIRHLWLDGGEDHFGICDRRDIRIVADVVFGLAGP